MSKIGKEFLLGLSNHAHDLFQQGDYWRRVVELNQEFESLVRDAFQEPGPDKPELRDICSDPGKGWSWCDDEQGVTDDDVRRGFWHPCTIQDKMKGVLRDYLPPNLSLSWDLLQDRDVIDPPTPDEEQLIRYRLMTLVHDGFGFNRKLLDDGGEAAHLAKDYLEHMAESEAGRGYLDSAFNRVREELLSQDSIHAMTTFTALRQRVDEIARNNHPDSIAYDTLCQIQVDAANLCISLARERRLGFILELADVRIRHYDRAKQLEELFRYTIVGHLSTKYPNENLDVPHYAFEWTKVDPGPVDLTQTSSGTHFIASGKISFDPSTKKWRHVESKRGAQTPDRWPVLVDWLRRVLDVLSRECGETQVGIAKDCMTTNSAAYQPTGADQKPKVPKRPSQDAFIAWNLYGTGKTQTETAVLVYGDESRQGQVSRDIAKVKAYFEAGGVAPNVLEAWRAASSSMSMDPDVIDMGERTDGLTPRQRLPRSEDDD